MELEALLAGERKSVDQSSLRCGWSEQGLERGKLESRLKADTSLKVSMKKV